jgi:proline iminopeptidase
MLQTYYPEIEPYKTYHLPVDSHHTLYVEECGNPQGLPVVFLHGGPGGGCTPSHRRFFNPKQYRIVLFDQRGSGRSTPHASLQDNTTQHLVSDIETIRNHLGIEKWLVFGGSWGSTLGLVYAQTHPEKVLGLILRGIFLARDRDIQFFYQHGTSEVFADYWEDFAAPIPAAERHDMVNAYYRLLTHTNPDVCLEAAKAWSIWEGRCSSLYPNPNLVDFFSEPHTALSIARIECHYFKHNSFLRPNQILEDAQRLRHIPGIIVHGRYDVVCPFDNAWALHKAWPQAELHIIHDAGHAASEPGNLSALVTATQEMARRLGHVV